MPGRSDFSCTWRLVDHTTHSLPDSIQGQPYDLSLCTSDRVPLELARGANRLASLPLARKARADTRPARLRIAPGVPKQPATTYTGTPLLSECTMHQRNLVWQRRRPQSLRLPDFLTLGLLSVPLVTVCHTQDAEDTPRPGPALHRPCQPSAHATTARSSPADLPARLTSTMMRALPASRSAPASPGRLARTKRDGPCRIWLGQYCGLRASSEASQSASHSRTHSDMPPDEPGDGVRTPTTSSLEPLSLVRPRVDRGTTICNTPVPQLHPSPDAPHHMARMSYIRRAAMA